METKGDAMKISDLIYRVDEKSRLLPVRRVDHFDKTHKFSSYVGQINRENYANGLGIHVTMEFNDPENPKRPTVMTIYEGFFKDSVWDPEYGQKFVF